MSNRIYEEYAMQVQSRVNLGPSRYEVEAELCQDS